MKVINVSNRLPVTLSGEIQKSSGGLVAALEGLAGDQYGLKWIGWPGAEIADPCRQRDTEQLLGEQFGCAPVFLSAEEIQGSYEGFSNSSLWPLLHYMPTRFRYEPQWWEHYQNVNQRFAQKVLECAADGDLVWVHDYQLMLLPAMLRAANPSLKTGFFLHTPFPSYETIRCHPRRDELVSGLLGADLIGFHTFGYLRHYCSAAMRLLGVEATFNDIRHNGRVTALGVYPIGVNAGRFEAELDSPAVAAHLCSFRKAYAGKRLILSVERMDYTKGILQRLDAIDQFLSRRPGRDDVKFLFVSVPSREQVGQYRELREEVEAQIGRLNGRHASLHSSPIHFIHGTVDFSQLCALYALADVGLVTPLIDGMNLVAKEFVACQRDDPGVLILSEFAGAAQELFSASIVNPYDAQSVAAAIDEALTMAPAEKARRMQPMRERVMRMDANRWARWMLHDLAAIAPPAPSRTHCIAEARDRIYAALQSGRKVAMFLDYDGTLREIEKEPSAAAPNPATRAILQKLRNRPGLDVTIISGRTSEDLDSFVGSYEFGLIAEHGAVIRRQGQGAWERMDRNLNHSWMEQVLPVMRLYESSTPGSILEQKRTSLVWHYRRTDPQFGSWKARALVAELTVLTANMPLRVRHGKKIVEVTTTHLNKGAAILQMVNGAKYDLIVCAGDDATDEDMYQLDVPRLISIHVGLDDTRADFCIASPQAFRAFLTAGLE
jgi:trehalose 6-phosphate synthase/phosphatase